MKNLDYVNIHSVNLLYLLFDKVDGYTEESNGNKYLILAPTNNNKEMLTKYTELWDKIENLIEKINGIPGKYKEGFKFDIDVYLPLGKILSLYNMKIVIRSLLSLSTNFFRWMFVWVIKVLYYNKIGVSGGIDINELNKSKECMTCHYWQIVDLNYTYLLIYQRWLIN